MPETGHRAFEGIQGEDDVTTGAFHVRESLDGRKDIILRGVLQERQRKKPELLYVGIGVLIMLLGGALFFTRIREYMGHQDVGFKLPSVIVGMGGILIARGLFR